MEKCKPSMHILFAAIEKGFLSQVQKIWRDLDDVNFVDTVILNNIKVF